MKYTKLTAEEEEINAAMDRALDAQKEEKNVMLISFILWLIGFLAILFSPLGSITGSIGTALLGCAIMCALLSIPLGVRSRKHRRAAISIMEPYQRRKALPFYQELTEMFADKPGVHLHLNDNGSITVTDKRKQENSKLEYCSTCDQMTEHSNEICTQHTEKSK